MTAEGAAGVLPATATYPVRQWYWRPTDGREWDDRDGTLTIVLRAGKTDRAAVEVDRYGVQEEPPVPLDGRHFLLLNDDDPDQADVYRVVVGPAPGGGRCSCKAGLCKLRCKHLEALTALIAGNPGGDHG